MEFKKEQVCEMFQLLGAHIIHYNNAELTVTTARHLPLEIAKYATSMTIDAPIETVQTISGRMISTKGRARSCEYTFSKEVMSQLYAALLLYTENQRYEAFCKSIDKEVSQELGTSEAEV